MKNLIILHGDVEEVRDTTLRPFLRDDADISYAHFTQLCKERDIHCVLAAPTAYVERGVSSGWHHNGTQWTKEGELNADAVQDRFSAPDKVRLIHIYEQLLEDKELLVNNPELERLCKDKFPSREYFDEYFIDTMLVNGKVNIDEIKNTFTGSNPDFDKNILVFKP